MPLKDQAMWSVLMVFVSAAKSMMQVSITIGGRACLQPLMGDHGRQRRLKGCEAGSTEGPQHPLVSEIEREKVKPSREGIPESNRGRITSENRAYPAKEEARKLQCLRVSVRRTVTKTSRLT